MAVAVFFKPLISRLIMASKDDWLPNNREALHDKAKQTKDYITESANRTRLGFSAGTTQGDWLDTVFLPLFAAFATALDLWRNVATRTQLLSASLYDSQKLFVKSYRQLYTGFLKNNPTVSDIDLVAMGFPVHGDSKRTQVQAPSTTPEAEVRLPSQGVVEIYYRNEGSDSKAKPAGVHGVEIAWEILDAAPTDWAQLGNSSFDTHSPFEMTFSGDKRGKHLYFALRWENTRGEKGHWSPIRDVIIP
jgi:hypothetical protein